jgi:thioredoxin 1
MAVEINASNFEEVLNTDKPVMIDFWAAWCGPCRMIAPLVDELTEEYKDKAVIAKVDVDSNQEIAMKYGVRNIPTILFIRNGEVVDKSVGAVPKNVLSDKIDAQLAMV